MSKILFVCLGNICRSPMAEGVFREVAKVRGLLPPLEVESAGTGSWHVGEPPDERAQAAAGARGIDISRQRARQVSTRDFDAYDLILAMDRSNLAALKKFAPPGCRAEIRLFMEFASGAGPRDVPDPYFGASDGFAHALNLIEAASQGLAEDIASSRK